MTAQELASLPLPSINRRQVPWRRLLVRMAPVTIVYFCYGWTLWLFLSWIPQYFLHSQNLDLKQSALFASCVFFAGVLGDTLGGIVTDRISQTYGESSASAQLHGVRLHVFFDAVACSVDVHAQFAFFRAIAFRRFFFAEMTIGPMWATPMDIAPNHWVRRAAS